MELIELYVSNTSKDLEGTSKSSIFIQTRFEVTNKTGKQFIPVNPKDFKLGYLKINSASLGEINIRYDQEGRFSAYTICMPVDKEDCLDKLIDVYNSEVRKAHEKYSTLVFVMSGAATSGK